MLHRERDKPVSVSLDGLAWPELHDPELVRQPSDHHAERLEQGSRPARAIDDDGQLATAQRECLEHSRQAQDVICVEVRQQDVLEIDETRVGSEQLTLRPFATVHKQAVASAPHESRRGAPRCRRRRAGRAEEEQVEIHGRRS